ncbi:putative F-box protein At1g32420 isoform X2 [Rutidosis leptorrhynchoides]|uniref:putative F-box protein At1g32420 isoform X2 n=1 Tax=Rutidosis leptorrhynchoides TaxID=125765 RepID=UPI003A98FFC8
MEQASRIVPDVSIVRCCNNFKRRRKGKEINPENISSFLPGQEAKSGHNTDIHNPLKNMETSGGDELPVDSIYNILSRLPLKSLARFQCVSKVWCKYINDPYLEIMHAKQAMKDPMMLIMFQLKYVVVHLKSWHASTSFSMLVTKEEEECNSSNYEVMITTKNTPYMKFPSKEWGSRLLLEDIILGSCKGLMISSQDHHQHPHNTTTVLLVINPLKKECYKLPPIKIWSCTSVFYEREACGLGFDESTNTYKMVCVVLRNQEIMLSHNDDDDVVKEDLCTMVHVLGTDSSSWREVPQVPPYPISGEGVFANGCLHWLVSYHLKYWPFGLARKVICFDMMNEEFGLIDPPNTLTYWGREHLVDLDGQVGLVYNDVMRRNRYVEVWLLNPDTKCWVIHCRFDKKPPLPLDMFIKVIGYWNKDAGDILITNDCRTRLFIYRLKQGVLHEANFIYQNDARKADFRLYQTTFSSTLRRSSIKNK